MVAEIITVERRRWSDEDKRQIVGEALALEASVNAVEAARPSSEPGILTAPMGSKWRTQAGELGRFPIVI